MPPTSAPAPRRGRPPIPGLRETILRSAADVFARRPYHAVLMDEVAEASGVGKGTLYRYFPSKRDLFLAVTFDGIEELRAAVEVIAAGPDDTARKLERIVRCMLAHFWTRRVFFALIHDGERDDAETREWLRRRAAFARVIVQVLEEGVAARRLRTMDPRIGAELLLGMMRGANRYRHADDTLDRLATAVTDLFLRGARASALRPVRRRSST